MLVNKNVFLKIQVFFPIYFKKKTCNNYFINNHSQTNNYFSTNVYLANNHAQVCNISKIYFINFIIYVN